MAYKLVISDQFDVPVKGALKDGSGSVPFSFSLQMRRLGLDEYRDMLQPQSDVLIRDFLRENVRGWRGQRLVLDESDAPASYSLEAFDCLLSVVGLEQACFQAYLAALQVGNTPAGRAGN